MSLQLADLSSVKNYKVRLEFTEPLDPSSLAQEMPYVSLLDEIEANTSSNRGEELRKKHGRIPYSSPLYWWESYSSTDVVSCEYIGQTVDLTLQKRFHQHAKIVQLLATHVNKPGTRVMFRMCSRFDIHYDSARRALEHLPHEQAIKVINDVEAHLIFENQPSMNTHHKRNRKKDWKPFVIETCVVPPIVKDRR